MQFLPWYNAEVINFLNHHLTNKMDVFEYGGGNSTLYYANKVASVSTIETRKEWLDFVLKNATTQNIEIKLPNTIANFANEIENFQKRIFDIIVVDSRDRAKCLIKSVNYIKKDGLIILDNSERENLSSAKSQMREIGFKEQVFSGVRLDGIVSVTSIFNKSSAF